MARALPLILRRSALCRQLGVSRGTIDVWLKSDPTFPAPIRLGAKIAAWRSADILQWIDSRPTVGAPDDPYDAKSAA